MKAFSEREARYERSIIEVVVHQKFQKEKPYDLALLKMERYNSLPS